MRPGCRWRQKALSERHLTNTKHLIRLAECDDGVYHSLDLIMKTWLRLTLVTVSVGGGVTGVYATASALTQLGNRQPLHIVLLCAFLLLFAFVTAAGLAFVNNPDRTGMLQAALVLQIPLISSPIIVYRFVCALIAAVSLAQLGDSSRIGLHFGYELRMQTLFKASIRQDDPWELGVNLFPLFLLVMFRQAARSKNVSETLSIPDPEPTFWDTVPKPPAL